MAEVIEGFYQARQGSPNRGAADRTNVFPCTISTLLRNGPADPHLLLSLLSDVLGALGSIHANNQRHEPLSPASVTFAETGAPSIRTITDEEAQRTVRLSGPKYLPPEAFHETDGSWNCARADAYVLGLIFYEVLLGREIFHSEFRNVEDGPSSSWLAWHADRGKRIVPPAELLPFVPAGFSNALEGMLEKDPEKRISDPNQLIHLLRSATETTIIPSGPAVQKQAAEAPKQIAKTPERVPKTRVPRPKSSRFVSVRLVFLVLALVLGGYWLRHAQVSPQTPNFPAEIETDTGVMVLISDLASEQQTKQSNASFYIDRSEVSQSAYKAFCEALGRPCPTAEASASQRADEPIRNVSWYEARAFAEWAGKRLASVPDLELVAANRNARNPSLALQFSTDLFEWVGSGMERGVVDGRAVSISDVLSSRSRKRRPPALGSIGFRCAADTNILRTNHFIRAISAN